MSTVSFNVNTEAAIRAITAIQKGLTRKAMNGVVRDTGFQVLGTLVSRTPKGWFGSVRKSWENRKVQDGAYLVANNSPIMNYLEDGTKAHGPRGDFIGPLQPGRETATGYDVDITGKSKFGKILGGRSIRRIDNRIRSRRKRALFVPLTKRAATATQGEFEVGTLEIETAPDWVESARVIFKTSQSVRKGKTSTKTVALIYGQDYVLAKRVKGITASHMVRKYEPTAQKLLRDNCDTYIRGLIAKV